MSPAVYGSGPAPFMVCVYFEVSVNCPSNICLSGQYFTVDNSSSTDRRELALDVTVQTQPLTRLVASPGSVV